MPCEGLVRARLPKTALPLLGEIELWRTDGDIRLPVLEMLFFSIQVLGMEGTMA